MALSLKVLATLLAVGGAWIDVPFVQQEDANGCGAASAQMVFEYWQGQGYPDAGSAIASPIEALGPDPQAGLRGSVLQSYFEQTGFQAFVFRGTWDDLSSHTAQGRPLIVSIDGGGSSVPLHYVVVCGVDSASGLVLVNDPARRKLLALRRTDFEKGWSKSGNWALLVVPPPAG